MKILLIQPNASERMVGFSSLTRPEPLALEIIAGSVPEHEVQILDLRIDPALEATLASFKPELVGVTGYTTEVPRMLEVCCEVKQYGPGIVTAAGGLHASLCPQDFDRDFVDVVVVGEGEVTFRELVSAIEDRRGLSQVNGIIYRHRGRQVSTQPREPARTMDELPLPARHLADKYRQHYHFHFWERPYSAETSRGCPYRCTFCAVWKFHRGRCRFRSPEVVLRDLRGLSGRFVSFVDDNFLQDAPRVERLYELTKAAGIKAQYLIQARADSIARYPSLVKKWAELGLVSVLVGFEKFRDSELASVNKRSSVSTNEKAAQILRDSGIDIWGTFIVDPQWTRLDFDALIDYVRSIKVSFPIFTVLTPIPGTAFFQEKLKELTTSNYEVFDFLHSVLPTRLPIEEFYSNMARLYTNTTLGLSGLKQRIRSGRISFSALERARELLRDVMNPDAYLRSAD